MNKTQQIALICPANYGNKVAIIKAIRTITGLGLKEAKDASDRAGVEQVFDIALQNGTDHPEYKEAVRVLQVEGVQITAPVYMILAELRELAQDALKQGEDDLANEILQLVLAEKLRRKL